jgi:hypothetical protein
MANRLSERWRLLWIQVERRMEYIAIQREVGEEKEEGAEKEEKKK